MTGYEALLRRYARKRNGTAARRAERRRAATRKQHDHDHSRPGAIALISGRRDHILTPPQVRDLIAALTAELDRQP